MSENQKLDGYKRIDIDGVKYYGKHIILSASLCNDEIKSTDAIGKFIKELVDRIDMVAYGEPVIARFGGGIEVGISAVQLIETSAITIHTNDGARDLYLDVFSCKTFSEDDVLAVVKKYFSPDNIAFHTFYRK